MAGAGYLLRPNQYLQLNTRTYALGLALKRRQFSGLTEI